MPKSPQTEDDRVIQAERVRRDVAHARARAPHDFRRDPRATRIFGHGTDEALGLPMTILLPSEMRRRGDDLARIPVIALTAYATRDDRVRIVAAGFQMHLTKPIDPMEVATGVANVARTVGNR